MSDHRRISANDDGGYPKTSQETNMQTQCRTCNLSTDRRLDVWGSGAAANGAVLVISGKRDA